MSQKSGDNCQNNQAGGNIDITNNYGDSEKQEFIDYEIISEIFEYLFKTELPSTEEIKSSTELIHLKEKIPLNFSSEGESDVEELFMGLWSKKSLVEKYIKQECDDEEKIKGLVFKFQECFRKLKKSETHEIKVQDINIFSQLANYCIPQNKIKDSRFLPNALAVVLYFFENCDFGKRTKSEKENKRLLF